MTTPLTRWSRCVVCQDRPAVWLDYCRPCARGIMARLAGRVSVAALLGIVACTAPPAGVDATERGGPQWVDVDAARLCVPVESLDARGYLEPVDDAGLALGCGQDLEWPCERGPTCSAGSPDACVCKCDVGRDDDCAGAWFAHWYPGAVTSATCDAGVCVLRRAR